MRNLIEFSSWQGLLSTLLGLVLVTVVTVGIRLLVMQRVQQRRERQNRQSALWRAFRAGERQLWVACRYTRTAADQLHRS